MIRKFLAAFFCVAGSFTAFAEIVLTGRVVDEAGLLSVSEYNELDRLLAEHEKATSNQVVVVTVKTLGGQNIADFGYQLGRQWGIGTKERNNGVLLIVAPNEREVRIEVGYGLEGVLTDAASKLIIERHILPDFRRNEMGRGIVQGARAIVATLGGELMPVEPKEEKDSNVWNILVFFVILFVVIVIRLLRRRGHGRGPRPPHSGYGGRFWGGGGSSGGGGFRGGGGSFGGGGASGRW